MRVFQKEIFGLEKIMNKFLSNLVGIFVYAIMFAILLWIINPDLKIREYIGLSLISALFFGIFNEIIRAIRGK